MTMQFGITPFVINPNATKVANPELRSGTEYVGPKSDFENPFRTDASSPDMRVDSAEEGIVRYQERMLGLVRKGVMPIERLASLYGKTLGSYVANKPEDHAPALVNLAAKCLELTAADSAREYADEHISDMLEEHPGKLVRIAVTGSRSHMSDNDRLQYLWAVMAYYTLRVTELGGIPQFISGGANGPDTWVRSFCEEFDVNLVEHALTEEDWEEQGKRAGFLRNQKIWDEADLGITMWDGKSSGSRHSLELAGQQNKPLIVLLDARLQNSFVTDEVEAFFDGIEFPDAKGLIVRRDGTTRTDTVNKRTRSVEALAASLGL